MVQKVIDCESKEALFDQSMLEDLVSRVLSHVQSFDVSAMITN